MIILLVQSAVTRQAAEAICPQKRREGDTFDDRLMFAAPISTDRTNLRILFFCFFYA